MGKRNHQKLKIIIYLTIGGLMCFMIFVKNQPPKSANQIISPLASSIMSLSVVKQFLTGESLNDAVNKALEGTKGTYGIVIRNLKTGESFSYNEHRPFQSGSLYKLWIMATAFKLIENGELNKDEILREEVSKLNRSFDIYPEQVELIEGEITLTVNQAIKQMITISHNYAALILSEKINLLNVRYFLQNQELTESIISEGEPPTTTANDIALFLRELYKGQLANTENTDHMIALLKQQTLNDKLPKYLPENVEIAHKTGEIDRFSHDAGIVFFEKGDYIIVVLSETDNSPAANERIADISKKVFEYFNK